MAVLDLILPVFAVMVTGYVFARFGFLPEEVGTALIQFVFKVSVPALLFLAIAQEDFGNLLNWPFIAAFGGVTIAFFVLILFGDRLVFKSETGPATMMATICVGSNTGIIALPLLHSLFGKSAVLPAAIANIIIVLLFLVQILLLEADSSKDPQDKNSTFAHIKNAILNPVILSTILGIAFAATPYELPTLITDYFELFAAALAPCALFAIGMSMNPAAVVRSGPRIVFASLVKLVALPAVVFAAAWLLDLNPLLTIAAVIAAAVPTAKTEFVMAKQYHVSEELVANTISLTTVLAIVSLIVWLVLLSTVYPTAFKLP